MDALIRQWYDPTRPVSPPKEPRLQRGECCTPEERQVYLTDPGWRQTFSLLQHGYWHVTTPEGWDGICSSGAIKPNTDGSFPTRWGTPTDGIALFDFVTPTELEVIEVWARCVDVMVQGKGRNILLCLDRDRVCSGISRKKYRIPFVEVRFHDEIPVDAITRRFLVPTSGNLDDFALEPF
jgi:hypothetical protein